MEVAVGTKNMYDILLDVDSDSIIEDLSFVKQKSKAEKVGKINQQKTERKPKAKPAVIVDNKIAKEKVQSVSDSRQLHDNYSGEDRNDKREGGHPRGGGRGSRRGGGYGGPPPSSQENHSQNVHEPRDEERGGGYGGGYGGGGGQGAPDEGGRQGGGGMRGRFRGGGGRGGYGFRGGKREFDRHSGSDRTGVKASEKREGGGAYNWGDPVRDTEAVEAPGGGEGVPPAQGGPVEEEPKKDWADEVEEDEARQAASGQLATPEVNFMTLDEYKALNAKDADKSKSVDLKLRRAGEGEDKKKWKNTSLLKKEEGDEFSVGYERCLKTSGRVRQTLDIDLKFIEPAGPSRGGRGGRGRGRGRGAGGGGYSGPGGTPHNAAHSAGFNVEEDFPELK